MTRLTRGHDPGDILRCPRPRGQHCESSEAACAWCHWSQRRMRARDADIASSTRSHEPPYSSHSQYWRHGQCCEWSVVTTRPTHRYCPRNQARSPHLSRDLAMVCVLHVTNQRPRWRGGGPMRGRDTGNTDTHSSTHLSNTH